MRHTSSFLSRFSQPLFSAALSPAVNHRNDEYGESLERCDRIIVEILNKMLHVSIKLNCNDFTRGGIDGEDFIENCKLLDAAGINSIEVSGNGTSVSGIRAHMSTAAKAADLVSCPVIVVGGFRSLDTMESVLNDTKIEFISLSRPLLREPDMPDKMAQDAGYISKCVSCNACYSSPAHKCVFRDRNLS